MRLRTQLLLVSLLTLALPWAGCQYVREFETALRQSQQDSLADGAGAIAAVLAERPTLLVRDPVQLVSDSDPESDIYASRLPSLVTLDGFAGDWSLDGSQFNHVDGPVPFRFAAGMDRNYIWLFLEVTDDSVLYETPGDPVRDRVLIDYEDPAGAPQQLLVATAARGRTAIRRRDGAEWVAEPRGQAVWEETGNGYRVEIRLRNGLVGARLGLSVIDADPGSFEAARSATFSGSRPGRLLHRLTALENALADFPYGNRRIVVTDPVGWVIAALGDTRDTAAREEVFPLAEKLLRRIIRPGREPDPLREARQGKLQSAEVVAALGGQADARWYRAEDERSAIVVAAHPIVEGPRIYGAVVLEQTSDAILTLTDRALARLVTLTLAATLIAALGLLGFATWLSLRIQRLSRAAQQAVAPDGSITDAIPGTAAGDELGDLSRNFSGLLGQLREHTDYLRGLAGKLSHELRTPLAVVQSSLDNLEATGLGKDARVYSTRAREGSSRLNSILTAMSEAGRVEQAIEHADVERFDLRALVEGCTGGYRDINPERKIGLSLPDSACYVEGVPELIAQMLDKLTDNAVDFSPVGGRVDIGLSVSGDHCRLSVANEGPQLPERMQSQLFDSMVSVRTRKGDQPHLGFGLHIARLIVEFHDGRISCRNLDDGSGVVFEAELPLSRRRDSAG